MKGTVPSSSTANGMNWSIIHTKRPEGSSNDTSPKNVSYSASLLMLGFAYIKWTIKNKIKKRGSWEIII